jgi:hypothetical protein
MNCEYFTLTEKIKLSINEPASFTVHHDNNILIKLKNGVIKTVIGCQIVS